MKTKVQYNSDSQSQSSSDYQDENLTQQQKEEKRNDKMFKNVLVFRFRQRQQNKKMKIIMQFFKHGLEEKRERQHEQRTNLLLALSHYENKLMSKGFDGFIDYAMVSMSFKQKIVMFYYKYLIGRCFGGWKQLYKIGGLKEVKNQKCLQQNDANLNETFSEVNKTLDLIIKNKIEKNDSDEDDKRFLQDYRKKYMKQSQVQRIAIVSRQTYNKSIKQGLQLIKQFYSSQKISTMKEIFKSIQSYQAGNIYRNRKLPNPSSIPTQKDYRYPTPSNQNFYDSSEGAYRYKNRTNQGFITANQSRQNLMDVSRRSAATYYNEVSEMNKSKSRRKLRPIVQEVKLPMFRRKTDRAMQPSPHQINMENKKIIRSNSNEDTIIQRVYSNKDPNQFRSSKISQQENHQRQIQLQKQLQKQKQMQKQKQLQQERERQRKLDQEKQKQKQKQERRNQILSIITKCKLMEVSLMKDLPPQSSSMLQNYKRISIQTLTKIKSI